MNLVWSISQSRIILPRSSTVSDAHSAVRENAIASLGTLCPSNFAESYPDVTLAVRRALKDDSRFVREKAAKTLSVLSIGEHGSIRDFVKAISDPEPCVRVAAITSLGLLAPLNDTFVIRAIVSRMHMAEDETPEVLHAVHASLAILQDPTGNMQGKSKEAMKAELKKQTSPGISFSKTDTDKKYQEVSTIRQAERTHQGPNALTFGRPNALTCWFPR